MSAKPNGRRVGAEGEEVVMANNAVRSAPICCRPGIGASARLEAAVGAHRPVASVDLCGATTNWHPIGTSDQVPSRLQASAPRPVSVCLRTTSARVLVMPTHLSLQGLFHAYLRGWLAVIVCAAATNALAQSPIRSIEVAYDGETYVVKALMFAPVSQAIAWDVLTDFPNMAKWVPNVRESTVVKPGDKRFTIEQQGAAKFAGLSFSYTSLREIVVNPQTTIESTQIKGSMKLQHSLMTVSAEDSGTRMQYRLEVIPSFLASAVMSEDFLKHEIEEQFTAIIGEMVRRKSK